MEGLLHYQSIKSIYPIEEHQEMQEVDGDRFSFLAELGFECGCHFWM